MTALYRDWWLTHRPGTYTSMDTPATYSNFFVSFFLCFIANFLIFLLHQPSNTTIVSIVRIVFFHPHVGSQRTVTRPIRIEWANHLALPNEYSSWFNFSHDLLLVRNHYRNRRTQVSQWTCRWNLSYLVQRYREITCCKQCRSPAKQRKGPIKNDLTSSHVHFRYR